MFRPHWVCPVQGCLCFPVYPAQAPGCSIWSGLCVACCSSFRVLHKSADSVVPEFCAFPGLSGSGSQELDGRPLPRCGAPSPLRGERPRQPEAWVPSPWVRRTLSPPQPQPQFLRVWVRCQRLVFVLRSWPLAATLPAGGCQPSRISESLWIETGGLFAVWEGMPSLGLSLPVSPPPCLLPPVGMGRSAAG